mgnify:CR=1 FL=1
MDYKDLMDGYESIVRRFPLPDYQVSIVHGKMKPEAKEYENAFIILLSKLVLIQAFPRSTLPGRSEIIVFGSFLLFDSKHNSLTIQFFSCDWTRPVRSSKRKTPYEYTSDLAENFR